MCKFYQIKLENCKIFIEIKFVLKITNISAQITYKIFFSTVLLSKSLLSKLGLTKIMLSSWISSVLVRKHKSAIEEDKGTDTIMLTFLLLFLMLYSQARKKWSQKQM